MSDATANVSLRRAYDDPGDDDGYRVLVDRVWPRGVSREAIRIDEWRREVAPSTELRRWYGHEVARWDEFSARYLAELAAEPAHAAVEALVARARTGRLTLVAGAKDVAHSQGEVLRALIAGRLAGG